MKKLVFAIATLLSVNAMNVSAADNPSITRSLDLQKTFGTELVPNKSQVDVRWTLLGKAQLGNAGASAEIISQQIGDLSSNKKAETRDNFWVAVNLDNGDEYLVEMPKSTSQTLRRLSAKAGWDQGHDAGNSAPSTDQLEYTKGLSNANDSRVRRGDNTTYPFSAMGQMNGGLTSGCSGTLVGRRHLLTAAHCLYDRGSETWSLSMRFRPGREGSCGTAACQPYGAHAGSWFFTPAKWRTDGGYEYDYGMVVLQGTPGYDTSWLGYVALTQDSLNDLCDDVSGDNGNCYNRGYPACGFPEAPLECRLNNGFQNWPYQDTKRCQVGSFGTDGDDGWYSRFTTNCDLSRGHSGSAIFTDVYNGNTKVVLGIVSTQSCSTCTSSDNFVNGIRRITPEVLDMISYFKAEMP